MDAGYFGRILSARSYLTWNRPHTYYEGSDWKGTWDREGGGVLIDQAIHSMDRVRYMLGSDIEWIEGSVHNHCHDTVRVEDAAEAAIQFKNGCIYNLYACNSYASDAPITCLLYTSFTRFFHYASTSLLLVTLSWITVTISTNTTNTRDFAVAIPYRLLTNASL